MDHKFFEELFSLTEAAKLIPGRPSVNSVWRWCRKGVISRSGCRIRLEHIRAGGKLFTTEQWVKDFCCGLAQSDTEYFVRSKRKPCSGTKRRGRTSRAKQLEDAKNVLAEAGI